MTLHKVHNPITKKTFMTALETIESTEENHADNVFPLIGDMCCLLYTSPSPRDLSTSRMPSSA